MDLEKLRDSENPPRIYVIATGAGSTIQTKLWSLPGASKYLVGSSFPYAAEATEAVLGFKPEHFVSPETAMAMAHQAYYNALCTDRPGPAVGLGMTCAVAGLRIPRGDQRIILAAVTATQALYRVITFETKTVGERPRLVSDTVAEYEAMELLRVVLNIDIIPPEGRFPHEYENLVLDGAELSRKVWFDRPFVFNGERLQVKDFTGNSSSCLFIPGAFNPLHEGHENLIKAASQTSGLKPILSITANPPHKAHLTVPEMITKLRHLRFHNVYFNQDPLFIDQARRFPGCSFAIGADAMDRMLDPKWCPVEPMLEEFVKLGTKFYVSSRLVNGEFKHPYQLWEKHGLQSKHFRLFQPVTTPRLDISSTQIREASHE